MSAYTPEALRLADLLEAEANLTMTNDYIRKAAHELRRLHDTIKEVNMSAAFTPEDMRDIHAELYAQKWRDKYVKKMNDGLKPQKSKEELDAITYAMYMGFRDGYKHYHNEVNRKDWYGLTPEDLHDLLIKWSVHEPEARYIEAKLKEKNFTNLYSQSLDNHQVTK
jgi:hypothetical protein